MKSRRLLFALSRSSSRRWSRVLFAFSRSLSRRWSRVHRALYMADKEPWVAALVLGTIVAAFAISLGALFVYKDDLARMIAARQAERRDLTCLARNVYFEARGEPMKGQRAVAEVTMNRAASGIYPAAVCEVVHQKNWDPVRKRYVGAFSWTEFNSLPDPAGEAWRQAWRAAEEVYFGLEPPVVAGAMHYHASYIKPDWAKGRKPIAKIGRHIFYR